MVIDQNIKQRVFEMELDDLNELQRYVGQVIEVRKKERMEKRTEDRVKTLMNGTCTIEREKEFFDVSHQIRFKDMSPNGVRFSTTALTFPGDILTISFRSPYNNELKDIFTEVLRVSDQDDRGLVEVAARGVEKRQVMAYKKMLEAKKNEPEV